MCSKQRRVYRLRDPRHVREGTDPRQVAYHHLITITGNSIGVYGIVDASSLITSGKRQQKKRAYDAL